MASGVTVIKGTLSEIWSISMSFLSGYDFPYVAFLITDEAVMQNQLILYTRFLVRNTVEAKARTLYLAPLWEKKI